MDMLAWKLGCLTCVLNLIMQFCKLEIGIIDHSKKEKKRNRDYSGYYLHGFPSWLLYSEPY